MVTVADPVKPPETAFTTTVPLPDDAAVNRPEVLIVPWPVDPSDQVNEG